VADAPASQESLHLVRGAAEPDPTGSLTSVVLHFSPRGHRSGLVAYTEDNRSVVLLVLPKVWAQQLGGFRGDGMDGAWIREVDDRTLHVVSFETSKVRWVCTPEWKGLLERCAAFVGDVTADDDHPDETDEALEALFDAETCRSLRGLFTITSGRHSPRALPEAPTGPSDSPLARHLGSLLRLVVLADRLKRLRRPYSPLEDGSGFLVDAGETKGSDPLRYLVAHAFVDEVALRQRDMRQGYRARTEWLPVIRGRVTTRGLARVALAGVPQVECTYDDFTSSIPLFQVIVTAIEHVASGAGLPEVFRSCAGPMMKKAARTRAELAHIPSLPLPVAAHLAGRLRLNRLQRGWRLALRMARILLRQEPVDPHSHTEGEGALLWSVDTSKVWEGVIAQMLQAGGLGGELQKQMNLARPWDGLGGGRPPHADLVTEHSDAELHRTRVILDAKYKLHDASGQKPTMAEQYQLFAYCHLRPQKGLTDWPPGGILAGLVYPAPEQTTPMPSVWKQRVSWGDRPRSGGLAALVGAVPEVEPAVRLCSLHLPFPSPCVLKRNADWDGFIRSNGKDLCARLRGLCSAKGDNGE